MDNGSKLKQLKENVVDYWEWRIFGQLQFAHKMSEVNDGKYESLVGKVLDYVLKNSINGNITQETAQKAEEMLTELSEAAKKYHVISAGHAHIDMNWMWGWDETVSITLDTFRTVLNLMEEYPDFKFSQSQASVYKIVEQHAPEMLEEIKKRVQEGRWEVTASTWVEADKNMPNGESMARHLLYTKNYLSDLLEIDKDQLQLDFEPDTFGHSRNVPEILNQGGVNYYYHCRGIEEHDLYQWQAPSGNSVLVYRDPYWYNDAEVNPNLAVYVPEFCKKYNVDTLLHVYGVGDHGGGPTRRDLERINDMKTWPVFPQLKFGTFKEYFDKISAADADLPVVDDEVNFVFTGCYTSQSRIKMANRYGENSLNEAEIFNTATALNEEANCPVEKFAEAWQNVLFNQFHDILPGSGIIDTREYCMGLFQDTMATSTSQKKLALEKLAANIDTSQFVDEDEDIKESISEGAGVGFGVEDFKISQTSRGSGKTRIFHVFNPALYDREEAVEIVVWDWQGDTDRIEIKDDDGNKVDHQLIDKGFNHYWGHKYMKLLLKTSVPACGYSTYILGETEEHYFERPATPGPRVEKPEEFVLENDYLRVVFASDSGAITSLYDKDNDEELVAQDTVAGIFRYIEEDDSKGMTSWRVGRYQKVEPITGNTKLKKVDYSNNDVRQTVKMEMEFQRSKLTVAVSLDYNSSELKYDVECDWQESGKQGEHIPQLGFYLPLAYNCQDYKYNIPFGTITREGMAMDVPANSWVLGQREDNNKKSVMLITDSKYGFRAVDNALAVTLLRGSYDPDPYPELGIHQFGFAIDVVDNKSNKELIEQAYSYNHPLTVISSKAGTGSLPTTNSLFALTDGNVAVSAIKMPETGDNNSCILRVYETEGEETEVAINLVKEVTDAHFVDVNERRIDTAETVDCNGTKAKFKVKPYSVVNVCFDFA